MSDPTTRDAQAIIDAIRETTIPQVLKVTFEGVEEEVLITTGDDGAALVTPIVDLFDHRAAAPLRRMGTITVHDLASFIAATNRDSDANSVIFADAPARTVTAILDFHNAGNADPRWCQDRIVYGFTLSPQLLAWRDAAKAPMDQKTFARLIDDRLSDVGDPAAVATGSIAADFASRRAIQFASVADLVVFTRTIAAKSVADSSEVYDAETGGSSIQYTKRNDVKTPDGAPVPVPAAFVLRIPILCGAEATEYTIAVRLRYDIDGGIRWRVELHALDKYVNAAIDEALVVVRGEKITPPAGTTPDPTTPTGCGLPVYMGAAPAPM